jgi:hypothetical protein
MLAGLAVFNSTSAQGTDPIWLDELKVQIEQEESCNANYFLNINKYDLAGDKIYEAKVQCIDGRQFDAVRTGETAKFVIKACQPVVC